MPQVISLGELLIDFVPTTAGLGIEATPTWERAAGGAPANVAVGIARLGGSAAFLGKVGADPFGYYLASILEQAHVDTTGLCFSEQARTALAFVALDHDGERDFVFYRHPSADMLHEPADIPVQLFHDTQILHIGSISTISEPSRSATLKAIEYAQAHKVLISFDPNLRLALWPDESTARRSIRALIPQAQIIKVSADELSFITELDELEAAVEQLWHENLRLLVITQGPAGCVFRCQEGWGQVQAPQVTAIDTTGAGDAFVAAMIAQIAAKPEVLNTLSELQYILQLACAAGALTTTRRGAIPALPTMQEIHQLVNF